MLVETHETAEIRKYLLGDIQVEDERRKIDMGMMSYDDFLEEILMQEEELIQDYVDDHLTTDERRKFDKHFFILIKLKCLFREVLIASTWKTIILIISDI